MAQIFDDGGTDGILLVDASNAFNQMNRTVAMHIIQITCPEMSMYIINTYRSPSRLFICGGEEILSQEGTTQGDPRAMPWYAPIIELLYNWYKRLSQEGKKFGYLVNGSKNWLIVKTQDLADEAELVFGEEVRITTEGQRHLGAAIGSQEYKDQYCSGKVQGWKENIELPAEIAKSQPHAAYIAFTKGYKSKCACLMRTIDSFEVYVEPIDEAINNIFLPVLFG